MCASFQFQNMTLFFYLSIYHVKTHTELFPGISICTYYEKIPTKYSIINIKLTELEIRKTKPKHVRYGLKTKKYIQHKDCLCGNFGNKINVSTILVYLMTSKGSICEELYSLCYIMI